MQVLRAAVTAPRYAPAALRTARTVRSLLYSSHDPSRPWCLHGAISFLPMFTILMFRDGFLSLHLLKLIGYQYGLSDYQYIICDIFLLLQVYRYLSATYVVLVRVPYQNL